MIQFPHEVSTHEHAELGRAARVVGWGYVAGLIVVVAANFTLRDPLLVGADMDAILRRVAGRPAAFRLSILSSAVYTLTVILVAGGLHRLAAQGSGVWALTAAWARVLYAGTVLLTVLSTLRIAALSSTTEGIPPESRALLLRMELWGMWDQYFVGLSLWAASSVIFYWRILLTGTVVRWLGVAGVVLSGWCAFCALTVLIVPTFRTAVNLWWYDTPMVICDLVLSVGMIRAGRRAVREPPITRPTPIDNADRTACDRGLGAADGS